MRRISAVFGVLLAAMPAAAQEVQAIEDVIARQLQAFNDRDVAEAWTYASPMIQGMFGSPETFGAMVQQGYPMVWTNRDPEFLDQRPSGEFILQRLQVIDDGGAAWLLEYQMVETPEGWQINGVWVMPAPDLSA